jgi:hypothetical protein
VLIEISNDPEMYGAGALALMAAALRRDETSLYRYAHVAGRWPTDAIARVVQRRSATGAAISWSHLVELSTVASRTARDALLERTFAESLSVRALMRIIRETEQKRRAPVSPAVLIERRIADVEEMSRRLAQASADYALALPLAAQSAGRDRMTELLGRAREAHVRLRAENAALLGHVAGLRRALRRPC